jgi:hypothetical protein
MNLTLFPLRSQYVKEARYLVSTGESAEKILFFFSLVENAEQRDESGGL